MKKIMVVFGTRPEAIKMCPLVKVLKKESDFITKVCVSGQHREMLQQVLEVFEVVPDYDLEIMETGQSLFDVTAKVLKGMELVLKEECPDIVLVHGDTTTAFSAALAAFYRQIPVGHVEAGLRTYNIRSPYPEEFNRQGISVLAEYHFAPTKAAQENLLREGKNPQNIYVTGNTVIDALKTTVNENYDHEILQWAKGSRLLLLTAHRRENLGQPLLDLFQGVREVADEVRDVKVVYPMHRNPEVRRAAQAILGHHDRIRLMEPLDVCAFHNFMKRAYFILTDSGGIQEEAAALGKPVLVLRDTTERREGIEAGILKLTGTTKEALIRECKSLLSDQEEYNKMRKAVNPYGNGDACEKIAAILKQNL